MIETKQITSDEAERIMMLEEGQYLDLKHSDIEPAKLSRTISAFANTSGGEVFLGVGEEIREDRKVRSWKAFSDTEAANAHLQVIERMMPVGNHYKASLLRCDAFGGVVLHIITFKVREVLTATNGTPYVRRGAQNIPVTDRDGLSRLELDKGIVSFEDQPVNVSAETISNSNAVIEFILDVVPTVEPHEWLLKQNLIVGERPAVAGVLLFSDEPQSALPK